MSPNIAKLNWSAATKAYAGFYIDPIRCMESLYARHGAAISVSSPDPRATDRPACLLLIGADYNREVLKGSTNFRPTGVWPVPGPSGSAQEVLRKNFLCMHGAEYETYSRTASEHLERSHVEGHFNDVKKIARTQVEHWPVGETVDLLDLTRQLAHHYAFSLLFGESNHERIDRFGRLVDSYHAANWSRAALFCRLDLPGFAYRKVLRRAEDLQSFVVNWAEERRGCPHDMDLRSAFVNGRNVKSEPMTPDEVAANLSGLAMASYETSAITLAWTLFLLALHPRVMKKLLDELAAAPSIDQVDLSSLNSLSYLDAVIKESLRLISPVPLLGFRTVKNCSVAGLEVEHGALVIISPHMTHRVSGIYESADRFRPERWSTIRPTAYEYLPFSAGERRCPGYWFAMNNLKVALSLILPRYSISVTPNAKINRAYWATMLPKSGIPVQLSRQDGLARKAQCTGSIFDILTVDD